MIIGILGDGTASVALVKAALNDTLEAHLVDAPDEEFRLALGVPKRKPPIYVTIEEWAERSEVPVDHYAYSDSYMIELVDHVLSKDGKIYALIGDKDPPAPVGRALVRALDNGLEVRDLAEAGLTVVGVADNPIQTMRSNNIMANKDLTITEAGEAADEGDEESLTALAELAAEYELDPDEYDTWAELAAAIKPLMEAAPDDEPEPEPEDEPKPKAKAKGRVEELTRAELEELPVPELRNLAKQLGVEGHDKNRSAKLIEGIIEAQGGAPASSDDDGGAEGMLTLDGFVGISAEALARGLRAFADALVG